MLAAIGIFLASLSLQDVLALMNWRDKQKTGDADEPSEPHPYPLSPTPYPLPRYHLPASCAEAI